MKKIKVRLEVRNKPPPDDQWSELEKELQTQGEKRERLNRAHKREVEKSYKLAVKARQKGMAVSRIATALGLSRQWISKMGNYNGRK